MKKWYLAHRRLIVTRLETAWKVAVLLCLLRLALG